MPQAYRAASVAAEPFAMLRWIGTLVGVLLVVCAGGVLALRAPLMGQLPVARAVAAAVPLPGGVLPPEVMDRTWYVQTDSSLYFDGALNGRFSDVRGSWTLDVAHPARMAGDVEVGIASVMTGDGAGDVLLRSAAWLGEVRYHDLTAQLTGVSGWPAVVRRAEVVHLKMDGRVAVRGGSRDVRWACTFEAEGRQMWLHCTAGVGLADFALPGTGTVRLTAALHFAPTRG